MDANGHQVGTGVSAQLANDDATNPPTTVDFAITQLPAVITSSTVFRRADTTVYNPTIGGYTWSDTVVDTGTITTSGIQEVTAVTISTRMGVAGIVWKQDNKYWLRGVPIAERGTTITLGGATRQGYARRPFLLFDAFVGAADAANHVLVEPDETEDGYHIRSLTINATTGALSWDPNASVGSFLLAPDAVALHSSGRVVAVHTDSGRLAHVLPAATPRPPLATYTAGPGTEIGLLSSPTAVAVTNPGTVIVLEAGAAQLAAFDLNGNPARYFGSSTPAAFTLPLPTGRTYLDLAVDGANQIYLLSRLGDGSQLPDYHIDVYSPERDATGHQQPRHQHPAPRRRLLAQHLRRQLHPPARHDHQPTPHRRRRSRRRTLPQPFRPDMTRRRPGILAATLTAAAVAASVAVWVPTTSIASTVSVPEPATSTASAVSVPVLGSSTTTAASCVYAETPPPPPPLGAVLWSPPQAGSTAPNTLVLNFGDVHDDHDSCGSTMDKPWVISVAKGAALAFLGTRGQLPDVLCHRGAR